MSSKSSADSSSSDGDGAKLEHVNVASASNSAAGTAAGAPFVPVLPHFYEIVAAFAWGAMDVNKDGTHGAGLLLLFNTFPAHGVSPARLLACQPFF